jgi:hypothetical protein
MKRHGVSTGIIGSYLNTYKGTHIANIAIVIIDPSTPWTFTPWLPYNTPIPENGPD